MSPVLASIRPHILPPPFCHTPCLAFQVFQSTRSQMPSCTVVSPSHHRFFIQGGAVTRALFPTHSPTHPPALSHAGTSLSVSCCIQSHSQGSPKYGVLSQALAPPQISRSCSLTVTGPSYTVAWAHMTTQVPPHIFPHDTPLLTERFLGPLHPSLGAEAGRAGPGARSRGTKRAHKGAAAERLHAGASGRWSPALTEAAQGMLGTPFRARLSRSMNLAGLSPFPSLQKQNLFRLRSRSFLGWVLLKRRGLGGRGELALMRSEGWRVSCRRLPCLFHLFSTLPFQESLIRHTAMKPLTQIPTLVERT